MAAFFGFLGKIVVGTIVGVLTAAAVAAIGLAITDSTGVTEVHSIFQGEVTIEVPSDLTFVCIERASGETVCRRDD